MTHCDPEHDSLWPWTWLTVTLNMTHCDPEYDSLWPWIWLTVTLNMTHCDPEHDSLWPWTWLTVTLQTKRLLPSVTRMMSVRETTKQRNNETTEQRNNETTEQRNNGTIQHCKTKASTKVNCGFRQHGDGNSHYRVQGFCKVRETTWVCQRRFCEWWQRGLDVANVTVVKFRNIKRSW